MPPRPPTLWQRPGLFIATLGNIAPDDPRLAAAGVGWVAPLLLDFGPDADPDAASNRAQLSSWRRRLPSAVKVLGWVNVRAASTLEGQAAADLVATHGLAGLIADDEAKTGSGAFASGFRAKAPTAPAMLSSYGYPPYQDHIAWRAYHAAQFRYAPQCYYLDAPFYEPSYSLEGWEDVTGASRLWVHPTFSIRTGHSLAEGLRQLRLAKAAAGFGWGFSVYVGEDMSDDDFRLLGAAGDLARR